MTDADIRRLVAEQCDRIGDRASARRIMELLVPPRALRLAWGYGAPGEQMEAWIVAQTADAQVALAYCATGFGPGCPWGAVFLEEGALGMDAQWHADLLAAAMVAGIVPSAGTAPRG